MSCDAVTCDVGYNIFSSTGFNGSDIEFLISLDPSQRGFQILRK